MSRRGPPLVAPEEDPTMARTTVRAERGATWPAPGRPGRLRPLIRLAAALAALALVLLIAQMPGPPPSAVAAPGDPPAATVPPPEGRGGISTTPAIDGEVPLPTTTQDTETRWLLGALRDLGCDVRMLATRIDGQWAIYLVGAPAFVNSDFPREIPHGSPLFLRCDQSNPLLQPQHARYGIDGQTITLVSGLHRVPAAPGSASIETTRLTGHRSYSDVDGDGDTDAAVILTFHGGGSGTFSYLGVVAQGSDGPAPTVWLGDRIRVLGVAAAGGRVTVSYLDRAADEPFAAVPTVPRTRTFSLEDGQLTEFSADVDPAGSSYRIEGATRTLSSGRHELPAVAGSASMETTRLTPLRADSDFDLDGETDAAVVLTFSGGGSGTFSYLGVVIAGSTTAAPTVLLGDRIRVLGVSVQGWRVTVSYLDRAPDEPFASAPTIARRLTFGLSDGELRQVSRPPR